MSSRKLPRPPPPRQSNQDPSQSLSSERKSESSHGHGTLSAPQSPRYLAAIRNVKYDPVVYQRKCNTVQQLQKYPPAPILRHPSLFMDESYERVVRFKKLQAIKKKLAQKIHLAFSEGNLEAQSPGLGAAVDEDSDTESALGEMRAEELRAHRQELWLSVIKAVCFIIPQTTMSEVMALSTLRRLLLPLIRRKLVKARRRIRERFLVEAFKEDLPKLTAANLEQVAPFLGWCRGALEELIPFFHPRAATPFTVLLKQDVVAHELCVITSGTVQVTFTDKVLHNSQTVIVEELGPWSTCGELSIGFHEPSMVEYLVGRVRVLYWAVSGEKYFEVRSRWMQSPDFQPDWSTEALKGVRARLNKTLRPLYPQCLQNCGRNRLFLLWSTPELLRLIPLFRSESFAAGEVIYHEGEVAESFLVVSNGIIDIYKADNSGMRLPSNRRIDRRNSVASPTIIAYRQNIMSLGGLVASFGPWQSIGDETVITGDRRAASVVARTAVDCWVMERDAFLDGLMASNARLLIEMKEQIAAVKTSRISKDAEGPAKLLSADPNLAGIAYEFVSQLAAKGKPLWFGRRDTIWEDSDAVPGDAGQRKRPPVFVVVSGSVRVSQRRRSNINLPNVVHDGAIIGLAQAICGEPWPFTLAFEAVSPVVVWSIDAGTVQARLKLWGGEHSQVAANQVMKQAKALLRTMPVHCSS
jgi:CRP-like cAMP-binding protein